MGFPRLRFGLKHCGTLKPASAARIDFQDAQVAKPRKLCETIIRNVRIRQIQTPQSRKLGKMCTGVVVD
jgi:hypothetical protein